MLIVFVFGILFGCSTDQDKLVVELSDQDEQLILDRSGETLSDILKNNGKDVAALKQKYIPNVQWDEKIGASEKIKLQCKCKVKLVVGGEQVATYETTKKTVGEFLKEKKIPVTPWDVLKTKPEQKIVDGLTVVIDKVETKISKEVEEIPFKEEKKESDQLEKGKKEIKQKGEKGKKVYEVVVTYHNGKPLVKDGKPVKQKRLVKEIQPINQLTLIGTKEEEEEQESTPSQTAPSGGRTMIVQATGYTHTGNRTATGTIPKRGTIAVDPRVIPLGTRIYVPGYGYGVAEDTGGAVNGRIIDLFFETRQEAINWGRRTVQIRILN